MNEDISKKVCWKEGKRGYNGNIRNRVYTQCVYRLVLLN